MRAFVFWIWSALSSLGDGLGAPSRVAVVVGLVLVTGVTAAITAPAAAIVMTHTRDRIVVLQQARRWTGRRPSRAERSRISGTHGIHPLSPLLRLATLVVPIVVGTAFLADTTTAYVDAWGDSDTETAFEDLVLFADRSPTDTGFLLVFGGLGLASVLLAYSAARITTSWRLARPSLSYAPTAYAIGCAVLLLVALLVASPLVLAYSTAYLFWVVVICIVAAVGKAPKTFVSGLLDTSERPVPGDPRPAPMPAEPVAQGQADGTRAMPMPDDVNPVGATVVTAATPTMRCQPSRPNDPATIGAYRIHGRLGSGAMGTVHLAMSPQGEQVALKVLSPALAHDDDSRRRFFRELHALRQIDSPRVVGFVDSGVVDDTPFIAMNAIEGPDLGSHVRDGEPLGPADLATLAEGLAEGLAAVHEQGLVHRDVKPSNIIWSESGPCLVDFGLAHLGDQTRVTSTGLVIGSPSYVSPERLRGTTAVPASDVWNWAACLVFAAAGRNLYSSDEPSALWHRVLNHDCDTEALERLREVDPLVYALAEECLHTEPGDRPRDGAELLRRYREAVA
ncbi:MAG: serine/threonine-protein kinase [Nocardioidaceae bacterium]